jgi:Undecaprenyl-phosphate glucose phosphotransferase
MNSSATTILKRSGPHGVPAKHTRFLPGGHSTGKTGGNGGHKHPVQPDDRLISQALLIGRISLVDALILALAGYGAHFLVKGAGLAFSATTHASVAFVTFATILLFQKTWLYTIHGVRDFVSQSPKIFLIVTTVFAAMIALNYLVHNSDHLSRTATGIWFAGSVSTLVFARAMWSRLIRIWTRQKRLVRRSVIVGGGPEAAALIEALQKNPDSGIEIVGLFDDRDDQRSPEDTAGITKLGTFDELVEFARTTRIDLLIVTLPVTAETRLMQMLKKLWVLPVDIRLSAQTSKLRFRPKAYSYIGGIPFLDLFDKPLSDWNNLLKMLEDRILGAVLLVLAAPVMALVALAVKLDSKGPALFKQKRYGFNNELIEVYKFRSMFTDMTDANAAKLATRDDPRITRVGRFIRKTSLDELPQLFNVVMGELSLVGPRPHAILASSENRLYEDVVDGYFARHRIKPGVTGWAQINGWRGETDTAEKIERRVEHDIYYMEHWSILFDLYIILMTPVSLLTKSENAY